MMAHLAYHISTGTPLWEYKVRKATVLYFALEDRLPTFAEAIVFRCSVKETGNLYFATEQNGQWRTEEQIRGSYLRGNTQTQA